MTATYSRIGLRNVLRNRRRSILTVVAVAFGLCCLIIFLGLKDGMHRHMIANTMKLDVGALQIHAAGYAANKLSLQPLADDQTVEQALEQAGLNNFSRRLRTSALILAGPNSSSVRLTGIDPPAEARVTLINDRLIAGSYLKEKESLLMGELLADSLGVKPGDSVKLMVWDAFGKQVVRQFPVEGVFRSGQPTIDGSYLYMALPALQRLLDIGDHISEIAVEADMSAVDRSVAGLRAALPGERYQVDSWEDIAPDVRQLIDLNDATMMLLAVIVFALVAMGIANSMVTAVYERFYEIGVLVTMGTTPGGIVGMVLYESIFLGAAACLLGSLVGIGGSVWLAWHGIDMSHWTSSNQYFSGHYIMKSHLTLAAVAGSNSVTLLTAFVAGIYPAFKAARLAPVDAIRHH